MEKVKVTKEQEKAIKQAIELHGEDYVVDSHCFKKNNGLQWNLGLDALNDFEMWQLAKAVYIGYEIEPEIGDLVAFEYRDRIIVIGNIVEFKKEDVTYALVDDPNYEVLQKIALSELRHATQEEDEQEKERRWWAKHGREVNEYRKDDVVINGVDYIGRVYEKIGTDRISIIFDVTNTAMTYEANELSLICPAENRLDLSN